MPDILARAKRQKKERVVLHAFTQCGFSCIPALRNQFSVHFPTGGGAVTLSCHRGAIFPTRYDLCPSSSLSLPLTPSFTPLFTLEQWKVAVSTQTHTCRHKLQCHINNGKCTNTHKISNFLSLSLTHKYSLQSRFWQSQGYNWHAMHTTVFLSLSNTHTRCSTISQLKKRTSGHRASPKAVMLAERPAGHSHSLRSHRLHPHITALPIYLSAYTDCLSKLLTIRLSVPSSNLCSSPVPSLSESIANETHCPLQIISKIWSFWDYWLWLITVPYWQPWQWIMDIFCY